MSIGVWRLPKGLRNGGSVDLPGKVVRLLRAAFSAWPELL